jgi:hypothetical protein
MAKRYTIRRNGMILGTYPGPEEQDALDAIAREEGDADFKASCDRQRLRRDNYTLEPVEGE